MKDTFSEFFYKIVFVEGIAMSNFIFIKFPQKCLYSGAI